MAGAEGSRTALHPFRIWERLAQQILDLSVDTSKLIVRPFRDRFMNSKVQSQRVRLASHYLVDRVGIGDWLCGRLSP